MHPFKHDFDLIQEIFTSDIGQPRTLEVDARAGIDAIWGSREEGGFTVSRGPANSDYELMVIPGEADTAHQLQKLVVSPDEMRSWFTENVQLVKEVLGIQ
jgi:hypothetical protein